jgi:hypothetical protein
MKPQGYEDSLYLLGRQEIIKILELIHRFEDDLHEVIKEAKLDDPLPTSDRLLSQIDTDLF